jgi:hypothetical protein
MECPVCNGNVEDLTPGSYRGLVVGCGRCGVYRVMQSCVTILRGLKIEQRIAALQKAKKLASCKSIPTISRACL